VIVDIAEERLFVISDLHLGNPASVARHRVLGFLDHVSELGAAFVSMAMASRCCKRASVGLPLKRCRWCGSFGK
jgi:hypothetical protein